MSGQSQWWSVILLILKIEPSEFLHALAGIHLGGEDISLSVDSDVVQRRKLANLAARAGAGESLGRCAPKIAISEPDAQ